VFEIGNALREGRVRRKVTLQEAEEDTKIRVKYIQAMENEDFDVMPSPAYVKGFLRTYASYLGLDADLILEEYKSRFEPSEEHEPFSGHSALGQPHRHARRNTLAFVAVVCLLVLVLVYILGIASEPKKRPAPLPSSPSASPSLTKKPTPSPSPSAARVSLRVSAEGADSWVEVRTGSVKGKRKYAKTVPQGQSTSVLGPFTGKVFLQLGRPSAVVVHVNGKTLRPKGTVHGWYRVTATTLQRL
jgi:cytoskeletal protein RodZ